MQNRALRAYGEVLRLVRRLPVDTRPYYAKYARENFVTYREVDVAADPDSLDELLLRAYNHSLWVLNKYSWMERLRISSRRFAAVSGNAFFARNVFVAMPQCVFL